MKKLLTILFLALAFNSQAQLSVSTSGNQVITSAFANVYSTYTTDVGHSISSFLWTKVSGRGTIVSPTSQNTGITSLRDGVNIFQITVTQDDAKTAYATISITVSGVNDTIHVSINSATTINNADSLDKKPANYYLDTTSSVKWVKVTATPTTVGGYGITDVTKDTTSGFDVANFGVKGDGSTNDLSALNAAFASIPAYSTLIFNGNKTYNISGRIKLVKPVKLVGNGAIINLTSADSTAISIESSNVVIDGLEIKGAGNATYADGADLIVTNGSNSSNYFTGIEITNCKIHNDSKSGMKLYYLNDYTISNNEVYDFPYAGIMVLSAHGGRITNNTVTNIHADGTPGSDAYGITIGQQGVTNKNDLPTNNIIDHNTIDSVMTWTGIDTHGSQGVTISNNTIKHTHWGIGVVGYGYGYSVQEPSTDVVVTGNTIVNDSSDHTATAIRIAGLGSTNEDSLTNCIVTNNIITVGNIYVSQLKNSVISNNTCTRPDFSGGIITAGNNQKLSIINNTIVDPYDASGSTSTGAIVLSTGSLVTGTISGNIMRRSTWTNPAGTYVNRYGIVILTPGSTINYGRNDFQSAVTSQYQNTEQPITLSGTGSPEGVYSAVVGSQYTRTDGGTASTFYIKQSGSDNTGWVAVNNVSASNLTSGTLPHAQLPTLIKQDFQPAFGANTTGGVIDWNDLSNILPGSSSTMLPGTAANGPGNGAYYHPFNFEYSTKDGSGNITQLAIPYSSPSSINGFIHYRGRYSNTWGGWYTLLDSSTIAGTYTPKTNTVNSKALSTNPVIGFPDIPSGAIANGTTATTQTTTDSTGKIQTTAGSRQLNAAIQAQLAAKRDTSFKDTTGLQTPLIYDSIAKKMKIDSTGTLKIAHIQGFASSAPTIAVGGSFTGTATVSGTDLGGEITLTVSSSTSYATLSPLITLTFHTAYGTTPYVTFSPSNSASGASGIFGGVYVSTTTTGFSLNTVGSGTSSTTTYKWTYHVIQ